MRKFAYILSGLTVLALLITQAASNGNAASAQQAASPNRLPNDLVFTGRESFNWDATPTIALVDAATMEVSLLYSSKTAVQLKGVSWSPQGDLLAVLHIYPQPEDENGYPTTLCIITVSGSLQTCLQEHPPRYFAQAPFLIDFQYEVTWSTDGKNVYYVAEDMTKRTRRLIEADAQTGATVRTIFETQAHNDEYIPTIIAWTPDLSYVIAGVGFSERSGVLIDMVTNKQQDLSAIVVPWPGGDVRERPERAGFVCNQFSPRGTYLTAIDEHDNRLLVFDTQFDIIHILDNFGGNDQVEIYCPTWSADESIIYFLVKDLERSVASIITYSLADQEISRQMQAPVVPPLEFSPDRTHVAFTEPDANQGTYEVKVLYPNGIILQFDSPFLRTEYPVWRDTSGD